MRRAAYILLVASPAFSCRTVKEYIPVERTIREVFTVRDTVVNTRLKPYRDSVSVNLATDTASYLENIYAFSRASVTGGTLTHTLGIKAADIPVKTQYIERIRTDSIPYPKEIPVPGETVVVHSPTVWQSMGLILAGCVLAILGLVLYRLFR